MIYALIHDPEPHNCDLALFRDEHAFTRAGLQPCDRISRAGALEQFGRPQVRYLEALITAGRPHASTYDYTLLISRG